MKERLETTIKEDWTKHPLYKKSFDSEMFWKKFNLDEKPIDTQLEDVDEEPLNSEKPRIYDLVRCKEFLQYLEIITFSGYSKLHEDVFNKIYKGNNGEKHIPNEVNNLGLANTVSKYLRDQVVEMVNVIIYQQNSSKRIKRGSQVLINKITNSWAKEIAHQYPIDRLLNERNPFRDKSSGYEDFKAVYIRTGKRFISTVLNYKDQLNQRMPGGRNGSHSTKNKGLPSGDQLNRGFNINYSLD